jgi:hypothetical protein
MSFINTAIEYFVIRMSTVLLFACVDVVESNSRHLFMTLNFDRGSA